MSVGMGGGSWRKGRSTELISEWAGTAGGGETHSGRRKACAKALRHEEGTS